MEANSIKKVVAMGIGAAVYIVLSRFAAIPTPIPNTTLQVTYAFLALMAFIYGPVVGLGVGFIGHTLNDVLSYGSVWFSWVIATAFFGVCMGLLGKMIKPENFDKAKAVKFIIYNRRYNYKFTDMGSYSTCSGYYNIQRASGKSIYTGICCGIE